jgi:hypothetical protein
MKKIDKVARYDWEALDRPGVFMAVPKGDLWVDPSYQREASSQKVLDIARSFSWRACGVLTVMLRKDGRMEVTDGQHRKLAADKRDDITDLPCLVFEVEDVAEAAQAFLDINTSRRPLRVAEKARALAVTGNSAALKAHDLAEHAGRRIATGSSKDTISCVAALMQCIEQDALTLERIWPTITDLCRGHIMPQHVVLAMFYAERWAEPPASLSASPWRERLLAAGYHEVLEAMRRTRQYHQKSGANIDADGLVKAINHRARKNLFALRTPPKPWESAE